MEVAIWLGIMILFLVIEAGTVGLVSIWFATGALGGLIAAAFDASLPVQIIVFVAISGIALAAVRPLAKKYMTPKLVKTNVDAVMEKEGIVIQEVNNLQATGTVKIGGMTWTARSTTGDILPRGAVIRVDRVEGVKLYVTLAEIPAANS